MGIFAVPRGPRLYDAWVCGVLVSHTTTSLGVWRRELCMLWRPCACVSSRRHPLQIPPPQFRGSCQCVGGLVSFKSLSRGRVGGGSSLSHVWLSVADSRVVMLGLKCNQCVVAPPVPAHRRWAPLQTRHSSEDPLNLEMTRRAHHGTLFLRQFSFLESCVGRYVASAGADGAHG